MMFIRCKFFLLHMFFMFMILLYDAAQERCLVTGIRFELQRRMINFKFIGENSSYLFRQFINFAQHLIGNSNMDRQRNTLRRRIPDMQVVNFRYPINGFQRILNIL